MIIGYNYFDSSKCKWTLINHKNNMVKLKSGMSKKQNTAEK